MRTYVSHLKNTHQYSASFMYIHRILSFQTFNTLGQCVKHLKCSPVFRHCTCLSAPSCWAPPLSAPALAGRGRPRGGGMGWGWWGTVMWPQPQARGCPYTDRRNSGLPVLAIFLTADHHRLHDHLSRGIWVNLKGNSPFSRGRPRAGPPTSPWHLPPTGSTAPLPQHANAGRGWSRWGGHGQPSKGYTMSQPRLEESKGWATGQGRGQGRGQLGRACLWSNS